MNIRDIKKQKIRYQNIYLPDKSIIKKKCSRTIIDSEKKLGVLRIPQDLSGSTVLDIGCAEGFFLREAIKRGAIQATGVDVSTSRINVNKYVNELWGFEKKIDARVGSFLDITDETFDVVLCIAVIHHMQRDKKDNKYLDTWKMITDPELEYMYKKHIEIVRHIASLTKKVTYFEYPYTYHGYSTQRKDVDFSRLGKKWEQEGLYSRVDFLGLSQKSRFKDRAVYRAYK